MRGAVGARFWKALHRLLTAVEMDLARWCVLQLDIGTEVLNRLFPSSAPDRTNFIEVSHLEGVVDPKVYQALWGHWVDREEEFYKECARLVSALRWRDVTRVSGPDAQILARLTREAFHELMSDEVPVRLKVGQFSLNQRESDTCRIVAYSAMDPVELPKVLIDLLHYFDGRPTDEVLQTILEEENIKLDKSLVRSLVDSEILVPCEG